MTLTDAPARLRAEHLDQAFGIGERRPRLSWLLPSGSAVQVAYRLAGDCGDTGWVSRADSVLVPWPFPPLGSAERVTVRVAVRTDLGESPWSEALQVETGLLDAADWDGVASWVAPVEDEVVSPAGQRPAYELRGLVTVDRPVARARLYATAQGLYEVFLGGVRAGDLELTPGFTQYDQRLQVQAYDVTGLLSPGMTSMTVRHTKGRYVSEWPSRSLNSEEWALRTRSTFSKSTSMAVSTWADVDLDRTMCSAVRRRMFENGMLSSPAPALAGTGWGAARTGSALAAGSSEGASRSRGAAFAGAGAGEPPLSM